MNGQPSPLERIAAEKAKKKTEVAQVYDGPVAEDHTVELPDDENIVNPDTAKAGRRNPIGDAIAAHNAGAPTPHRPGAHLSGGPTSPDSAPRDPRSGNCAPGAPGLSGARHVASQHPDSSSPASPADRRGDRAQTRAPAGLDFSSTAGSVAAASRNPDGSFVGTGDVPVAKLDLTRQGRLDVGQVFSRPNAALPGRQSNSPATGQPNVSTNERG